MLTGTRDTGECDRRCDINTTLKINKLCQPQTKVDSLVDIYNRAYRDYPEYADSSAYYYLKSLWEESNPDLLIAETNGKINGFIVVDKCWQIRNGEPLGEIHEFVVDYEARGQRVGSSLLEAGINYLNNNGIKTIGLWVGNNNEPAKSLYEKYGFKKQFSGKTWTKMERLNEKDERTTRLKVITKRIKDIDSLTEKVAL